ncbi:MAG: tRNA guanosine(34) transglycosylase Tgt [Alphaproteobacteria bacterium]
MPPLHFQVLNKDKNARRAKLTLKHGTVNTPAFMAVGTAGSVKGIHPKELLNCGTEIILANTYHLALRPGDEKIKQLGGLHSLTQWPKPILTDSGGFQIMSLAKNVQISEESATFSSHIDGQTLNLSPERATLAQINIGADIAMVLDQCIPWPATQTQAQKAMERSIRWARRCQNVWNHNPQTNPDNGHALFAIVQGGTFLNLRRQCAHELINANFNGYALGGLAVGEKQKDMLRVVEATAPLLPADKPRYLMGVGTPDDIIQAVGRGIDLFDCVMPTRAGRTGLAFTGCGTLNLRNACHAEDLRPLEADCPCPCCHTDNEGNEGNVGNANNKGGFTRAWLHHLTRRKEILSATLLTIHNLTYYQRLMTRLQRAIEKQNLQHFANEFTAGAKTIPRGSEAPMPH